MLQIEQRWICKVKHNLYKATIEIQETIHDCGTVSYGTKTWPWV